MKINADIIESVRPGSQAHDKGVRENWKVMTINGETYTHELMIEYATGQKEYDVTFHGKSYVMKMNMDNTSRLVRRATTVTRIISLFFSHNIKKN